MNTLRVARKFNGPLCFAAKKKTEK
jgi:hypothetical protein